MIPDIIELNFPKKDGKQYATLTQATASIADMGEKTITTQVKIDGEIVPDFSFDWEVEFQGEKYIMPLRIPQGAKENTSLKSQIDLTFQHWAIYQLKRWPFVTIQQIAAGTYLPDEEVATVQLNLKDFCILFGQVLEYYYGDAITIDLNDDPVTGWKYKQEATLITISHTKIWNVLIDAFYNKYGVRWEIKSAADNSNTVKGGERYVIRVGYPTTEVDHIFEYGFEGGLLKVERQVQSEEIRNMLKGRGGDTNIPFRYFKDTDPNNPDFRPDPDWVEELANIYFPNLMGATFRSYVQGWKAAHISKYPGYAAVGENNAYAPWAYRKGYTDTKFHPVEFVADEIAVNPESGDKQVEILPGYSPYVKKGSSLDKYGPLPDTLDNNDDIYPTIQGTGLDIAVDVEQVTTDDIESEIKKIAQPSKVQEARISVTVPTTWTEFKLVSQSFTVRDNQVGTLLTQIEYSSPYVDSVTGDKINVLNQIEESLPRTVRVINPAEQKEVNPNTIPAGTWNYEITVKLRSKTGKPVSRVIVACTPRLWVSDNHTTNWKETFDVWVKNIWDSAKLPTESETQYAERVWKPVLGDREGNEAAVMFTSGALVHEDYEFKIPKGVWPIYDTSKEWTDSTGTVHTSHWRITLAKSDAELEATGLYVPSTKKQGAAGDRFVFIGTEMTHVPYVVDSEKRLDNWKKDRLGEKKEIKPTAVVTTDRVRLNNEGKPNALINQLRVGNSLRLFDKRFFNEEGKAYETLYLQSITYTYREPSGNDAALNPDVEIVLGNEYATSANPVTMMQGEISAIQQQVGALGNLEQLFRAVGDKLYLRKDGISDRSLSPTQFGSLLTSDDFKKGAIVGNGWGFYKDEYGNWTLEVPRVVVRQDMHVNNLVVNQTEAKGGTQIETAAYIKCTNVVETPDSYICYFDQKGGTVANLFKVGDVAYCNRWTPENKQLKFYKRKVTAVDIDFITLSKSITNGTGKPEIEDIIIHFGNYTDPARQYVKIRDVVGGGYEQYIEGLDSVNAVGREYYFVGRMTGQYNNRPRFFLGDAGNFIEYKNGKLLINGELTIGATLEGRGTIADKFNGIDTSIDEVRDSASSAQSTADEALQKAEDAKDYIDSTLPSEIEAINAKLDGVVENWFEPYTPSKTNNPAAAWVRDGKESEHEGDTFTNTQAFIDNTSTPDAGKSWRWVKNPDGSYNWTPIADSDAVKALLQAAKAQQTADQKRRIFVVTPTTPYDVGDLWTKGTAGRTMRCIKARATGSYVASDWDYADNSADLANAAQQAADAARKEAAAAQASADSAKGVADAAKNRLDQWASDGVISPTEKQSLKDEMARILADKNDIANSYTKYGLGTPTAFNTAYAAYNAILVTLTAATPETIAIPSDFATKQTAYYTAYTAALNAISEKTKELAAKAQQTADDTKNRLDNLSIGGRNLLLNTEVKTLNAAGTSSNYSFYRNKLTVDVKPSTEYIFSVDKTEILQGSGFDKYTVVFYDFNNNKFVSNDGIVPISSSRQSVVLKTTANCPANAEFLIYNGIAGSSNGKQIRLTRFKLEEGNIVTDWSVAPEEWDRAVKLTNNLFLRPRVPIIMSNGGYHKGSYIRDLSLESKGYMSVQVINAGGGFFFDATGNKLEAGKQYSWAIKIKSSRAMNLNIGHEQGGRENFNIGTQWKTISKTFTAISSSYIAFVVYRDTSIGFTYEDGDIVDIADMMLVEGGTIPSVWYPSAFETKEEADSAQSSADQANTAVGDLNTYVDGAFKDGVISEAEAVAIEKYKNSVNETKKSVDASYSTVYGNALLTGSAKTNLAAAKTAFDTATTNLLNSITTAIADKKTTVAEKADVDAKYATFNTAYGTYTTRLDEARKSIENAINATANSAQALAGSLQTLYNNLNDIIIPDLQNQIDGAIEIWDGTAIPTLSNAPASGWTTATEKDRHIGDYYDREITSNGETSYERYKFTKTGSTYSWKLIADDGGAKALAEAQKALGIANGKNKVIYQTAKPSAPYNIDDLWIKTDTGVMYISNADRAEGATVGADDWTVINDTALRLRQMSSDNVISKEEKASLRNEWAQIQKEYTAYQSDATTYGVSITALTNAYNTLNTVLTGTAAITSDSDTTLTAAQRTSFNNAFASWHSEKSRFSNAVAQKKADDAVDNLQISADNLVIDGKFNLTGITAYLIKEFSLTKPLEYDKKYTIVVSGANSAQEKFQLYDNKGSMFQGYITLDPNTRIGVLKFTFKKTTASGVIINPLKLRLYKTNNNFDSTSELDWVCLYEGHVKAPQEFIPSVQQAQNEAIEAQKSASQAQSELDAIDDDNVVARSEKAALEKQLESIMSEYPEIISDANRLNISTSNYQSAYDKAVIALKWHTGQPINNGVVAPINQNQSITIVTNTSSDHYYGNIEKYYKARQIILNTIAVKTKEAADAAAEQAANEAADAVAERTGNLLPKRYMLDWNKITPDTCVRESDSDGDYYKINENKLYNLSNYGNDDVFQGKIKYRPNTQYVLSVKWKAKAGYANNGLYFRFIYSDGTYSSWMILSYTQTTITTQYLISAKGKTVSKICVTYGTYSLTYIYDIQLVVGSKFLPGWLEAPQDRIIPERNILPAKYSDEIVVDSNTSTKYITVAPDVSLEPNEDYILTIDSLKLISASGDDNWNKKCLVALHKNGIFYKMLYVPVSIYPQSFHFFTPSNIPSGCNVLFYSYKEYSSTVKNKVQYIGIHLAKGTVAPPLDKNNRYDNTKTAIDGGIVTSGTLQVAGNATKIRAGITGKALSSNPDSAAEAYNDTAVRFWAGEEFKKRETAPARILDNGDAYFSKCYSFFPAFEINSANKDKYLTTANGFNNVINLDLTGSKIYLESGLGDFSIILPRDAKYVGSTIEIFNPKLYNLNCCVFCPPPSYCTLDNMFKPGKESPTDSGEWYSLKVLYGTGSSIFPKFAATPHSYCIVDTTKYTYLKFRCVALPPIAMLSGDINSLKTFYIKDGFSKIVEGVSRYFYNHAIWVVEKYLTI